MALKLGTENKTKTYAAIGLGIVVLMYGTYVVHDEFFSDVTNAPPAPVVINAPVRTGARTAGRTTDSDAAPFAHQAVALPTASALDPTLHPEVMAEAEATTYTGDGRNIFSANSAPAQREISIPKPRGPIRPEPVIPQGPPPPPNIDLKFYGYSGAHGGPKKAWLLHGEDIFIASEGDVVDRRYKVVKINPFSIEIEDLGYNHTQIIPLTQN
jgi:hypothetical protein